MSQPKLILHIGTHKTGSTSIQAWMSWLDTQQVLPFSYARMRGRASAHHAVFQAYLEYCDVAPWHGLLAECRRTDAPFLLASAEGFSRLSPQQTDDLLDEARRFDVDVSVIAFLRPPAAYITSIFGQHVKSGGAPWVFFATHTDPLEYLESMMVRLAHWGARLGPQKFTLVPFQSPQWPDASLWSAWWQALGIAPPVSEQELPGEIRTRNASPSWSALAAVHHVTKCLCMRRATLVRGHLFDERISQPVEQRLRALGRSGFIRPPDILDAATRAEIATRIMPMIDNLARSLGLGAPFLHPAEDPGTGGDLPWFDDPYDASLPAEERGIVAHLIDYAEALAAIEMEKEQGAVSTANWLTNV